MRTDELRELKRLFDALQHAGNRQYKVQLRYVHRLLETTPRFRSSTFDFDPDEWMRKRVFEARQTCHEWPPSEAQKLSVLRRIMEVCATAEHVDPTAIGRIFVYSDSLDEWAQAVTTHVVFPLIDYLQTRLGTESEMLHQLERMRRQVEWFEQEKLYQDASTNTVGGEAVYDRRVREFLFAQGIDYPFSQPSSPSGKADVIAGLDADDPLVCEIKLYDGKSYGSAYLRKGVGQAIRYAHDYGSRVARGDLTPGPSQNRT